MQPGQCQLFCLQPIAVGAAAGPRLPVGRRLKISVRRHMTPDTERAIKKRTNQLMVRITGRTGRSPATATPITTPEAGGLTAGDAVRVRTQDEIQATLNHWRQLKGCTFMAEMAPYCGTTQRVLKPVRRFVDERDLRAKKAKGIVLLEGVMCQGTADFGPCDRSCHFFWREEWLEKIPIGATAP